MATAKKLPSGNYRARGYNKYLKKYKSFTAKTKSAAEKMAAEYAGSLYIDKYTRRNDITVKEAVMQYIESKEGILSPSSIRGYYIILRNAITEIEDIKISLIDEKDLQNWVSNNAKHYSPKSIKCQFGLVTAALRQNKINLDYATVLLPRLKPYNLLVPNEEQMGKILRIVEGTSIELAVTMAVTLGLRQSEIAGLKWSDYDGQYLYIHSAVVQNKEHKYVAKETTKSNASTRIIEVDELLKQRLDRAEHKSDYISPLQPSSVLAHFNRLCQKNGLPKFTMHAQRHANASLMLKQNIPDKYAMQRLGQSSNNMLKNIYQHTYDEKTKEVASEMSDKFAKIYATKI